jgi:hypothetical protein
VCSGYGSVTNNNEHENDLQLKAAAKLWSSTILVFPLQREAKILLLEVWQQMWRRFSPRLFGT